jgi:hypothetical protein
MHLAILTESDGKGIRALPFGPKLLDVWDEAKALGPKALADLGRLDRYFLLVSLLHREDAWHPWIHARCREIEAQPDGRLDLWAREHYKSTLITFAGSIQEMVRDPEITICIFSHTKPTALKFSSQIKRELEVNRDLQGVYPEVFYRNPEKESPLWSAEKGIIIRRKGNPREATLEAFGLVDGQPTAAHYRLRIYDDIVTLESVTTADQIKKVSEAWQVSQNLGARDPSTGKMRDWHLGTRYKFGDSYEELQKKKSRRTFLFPATVDGTPTGKPVFMTQEALDEKRRDMVSAIFAAQMLMNPVAGTEQMFKPDWPKFTDIRPGTVTCYIMCDPANKARPGRSNNDNTAMLVVLIDAGRNKYLADGYIHKMGLQERWTKLRDLWKKWTSTPGVQFVKVGYERYGMRDAMEHFEERQEIEKIGFPIEELAWPKEGGNAKYDRISRLEPDMRAGKWYFADDMMREIGGKMVRLEETSNQAKLREAGQGYRIFRPTYRMDAEGNLYSLNGIILNTLQRYPYVTHEDDLDAMSRIYDMDPSPPIIVSDAQLEPETFVDGA